jgi:hypothetical protein
MEIAAAYEPLSERPFFLMRHQGRRAGRRSEKERHAAVDTDLCPDSALMLCFEGDGQASVRIDRGDDADQKGESW